MENAKKLRITVLDSASIGDDLDFSIFEDLGTLTLYEKTEPYEICERAKSSDVLILNKVKINSSVMPSDSPVKLVCIAATGFDNIDIDFCRQNGIGVCNVVGYSTSSVAELTVSMAMSINYHLSEYKRHVSSGEYTRAGVPNCLIPRFHTMSGMTWGIIGYGNIGKKVDEIARAIGCKVLVYKRHAEEGVQITELDTLLANSDIVSIHTPLNADSRLMITKEKLALMKKSAILVNVARGAVCDEEAVADAILNGAIGGFACDVYSKEPFGDDHPFSKIASLDNVILTPHMAWGSVESRETCIKEIYSNILSFVKGEKRYRVDI